MEAYSGFASLYDGLMADIDYAAIADFYSETFTRYSAKPNLVLDLGCGTGTITRQLAAKGFDMIGVDKSAEMLSVAKSKDPVSLYIEQDIRRLSLHGTVDAVVSCCDVFNYLLHPKHVMQTFALVKNYLNHGGLFIFDVLSPYKYKKILADNIFAAEDADNGGAFIWQNYYYEKERLNEYNITFFKKLDDGLYKRFEEQHYQRAYGVRQLMRILEVTGLSVIKTLGEDMKNPPAKTEQRIYFIVQKDVING
ncbi:MAG: methyltransferase domain-containing protein [Defluviitaleaceae bacterium]|nr:methyltransferase domain-containing protein [Defluviitaleaceae bacterium]